MQTIRSIIISSVPLTWIAMLPINCYKRLRNIHLIISLFRCIEHGIFILLSFILFNDINNDLILWFKICICISFVILFPLYYYIVMVYDSRQGAVENEPRSTNRTLRQLLEFGLYKGIEEMYAFGFKYTADDWREVMQQKDFDNHKIVSAFTAFLSRDIIDVDEIFSSIKSDINVQDRFGQPSLH